MISEALAVLETAEQQNELSEIYERYKNRFYALAFSILQNRNDAEDAVEEAFLRIAKKPALFFRVDHEKRAAYVDVIVKNAAHDMIRKNVPVQETDLEKETGSDVFSLEELVIGKDSEKRLVEFISAMPEDRKETLLLKIYHALSVPEIADTLGISEEAVRKRLSNAYRSIREFLEKEKEP